MIWITFRLRPDLVGKSSGIRRAQWAAVDGVFPGLLEENR
jgi:hypothetical protein